MKEYTIDVTKEDLIEWKNHIVTKWLYKILEAERKEITEFLADGGTLGKDCDQQTAKAVGRIEALNFMLTLDLYQTEEGVDENESDS